MADPSSRRALPNVVCLSEISKLQRLGGLDPLWLLSHKKRSEKLWAINTLANSVIFTST